MRSKQVARRDRTRQCRFSKKSVDLLSLEGKALDMRQSCAQSLDEIEARHRRCQAALALAKVELEALQANAQRQEEELVLAKAQAVQASRKLLACKSDAEKAWEAWRPHARWVTVSARGGCREQDLETE